LAATSVQTDNHAVRLLAAALTLASGAVMMLAGYVWEREGWTSAGLITIPAGVLILAALMFARRVEGQAEIGGGRRVATLATTMVSGAVMVLAGYAAAAGTWLAVAPLALLGGVVIGLAFALDR
jgi:hypothetical protein